MIPFDLFKYIYFRNILYCLTITIPITIIYTIISLFILRLNSKDIAFILSLILIILCMIITILVNKFILNKVMFQKYKKITVSTELKSVSNKLAIIFMIIARIAVYISYIGFMKIFTLIFNNIFISSILGFAIYIFMEYYTINLFLSKYITVNKINYK